MEGDTDSRSWFDRLSIKRLSSILMIVTLTTGLAVSTLSLSTSRNLHGTLADWQSFQTMQAPRNRAIADVITALGYNGMIHRFKDYVIRHEPENFVLAQRKIGALLEMLDQLAIHETSSEQRESISVLYDAVGRYTQHLADARRLSDAESAATIDAAIRYDDSAVAASLADLRASLNTIEVGSKWPAARAALQVELQAALGFGGMIHRFKDFVLRGEEHSARRAETAAAEANETIAAYRQLDTTHAEEEALAVVEAMIDAYATRLAEVRRMHAAGNSIEEIDQAVRFDDRPAANAMLVLERELVSRLADTTRALSDDLVSSNSQSQYTMLATFLITGAGASVIFLVLSLGVVGRSKIVKEGLTEMSLGTGGFSRGILEADTEMGAIARAAQALYERSSETLAQKEQAILDSEARSASLINGASSAILSLDSSGQIETVNPATTELLLYAPQDLIGRHISDIVQIADLGELPEMSAFEETLEKHYNGEIFALRADETTLPVQMTVGTVPQHDRTIYTAILTDQSAYKAADQLRIELAERRRTARIKNEFVSMVSHELRTPLTSIAGALGLVQSNNLGEVPERLQGLISIASNNCDRLVRLVNDILDLEKIEAGRVSYDFRPLQVSELIEQSIHEMSTFASERAVHLASAEEIDDALVEADRDRIVQVLTNLLSNAVKFSRSDQTVTVTATQDNNRVRIAVIDQGVGVQEDFHDKVFERFAQADSSATREAGGTGLGLNISKSIVEAHGGAIGFASVPGQGATFWFELPVEIPAAGTDQANSDDGAPRVLICEDDRDIAMLLSMLVEQNGFRTETVNTLTEARELLKNGAFSAVTVDLCMPDGDGAALIDFLRQDPTTADLPVIIISARSKEETPELEGLALSVLDWMEKPIDPERLERGLALLSDGAQHALKILHIEDDADNAAILRGVVGNAAVIHHSSSHAGAVKALEQGSYDLVVLDLLLPDGHGETLLPLIEANRTPPPQVLVFSVLEPGDHLQTRIDAALVKSRTSNARLKNSLEKLLKSARGSGKKATAA